MLSAILRSKVGFGSNGSPANLAATSCGAGVAGVGFASAGAAPVAALGSFAMLRLDNFFCFTQIRFDFLHYPLVLGSSSHRKPCSLAVSVALGVDCILGKSSLALFASF